MIVSSLNNALKIRKRWRRILITKPNHRAVYGSERSSFLPCSSPRKHKAKRTKNKELHRTVKNYSSATVFRRHDRRLLVRLNALSPSIPKILPAIQMSPGCGSGLGTTFEADSTTSITGRTAEKETPTRKPLSLFSLSPALYIAI
jgi:hypothetical protein